MQPADEKKHHQIVALAVDVKFAKQVFIVTAAKIYN